jgi:hypothetical protein
MGGRAIATGRDQTSRDRHDPRCVPDADRCYRPRPEGLAIYLKRRWPGRRARLPFVITGLDPAIHAGGRDESLLGLYPRRAVP